MATYLVTGAAGFIGGAVAKRLVMQGHEVVTIDNLSTGFRSAVPDGVHFIEGGCQDAERIGQLDRWKFDAIFHIAGQSSGEISFDNPVYDLQTNTQSTLLLLKYAVATGCRKFLYASTMSVYGDQPDKPVREDALALPKSFYGVGKIASEHYLRMYNEHYGIDCAALRLFNVYGPGQNMENLRQGMVSIYLAQALRNRHIVVKGSPDRFRDFVYIDDVVDAFLSFLPVSTGYKFYNVATGVKTTVGALLHAIQSALPFETTREFTAGTPGDQFGITGDIAAIAEATGWRPTTALDSGLRAMVQWALQSEQQA